MFFGNRGVRQKLNRLEQMDQAARARFDLLNAVGGIGMWEAALYHGEADHPKSVWTWSAGLRHLLGFKTEAEFPNLLRSWSDRIHAEDAAATLARVKRLLSEPAEPDSDGPIFRLKTADGAYRWFQAIGSCQRGGSEMVQACGFFLDINARKAAEVAMAEDISRAGHSIEALNSALDALEAGNLTTRIMQDFPAKLAGLKSSYNKSAERLQETMRSIAENVRGFSEGTAEITRATDDLSRRTEKQAASLEETAAALDEITATVRKSAESATEARNVVTAAKSDAERSGEVVRETVNAMSGIETSSKQIGNIIGVIDEIAFQTNLLALNAGVEAARAGDAGRGFAVVATEVRALAQRSADAAKEIKALISTSGAQVQTGVKLVGETGKALGRIVEQVNRLNVLVSDIAGSAQEQATGLNEVNSAVNQMDQVTQQNAAMVEQTTAASHSLANEAQELIGLVGRFEIGALAAPVRKSASAPAKPQVRSRIPVHAPVAKAAVARPAMAGAEGDWDEF